MSIPRTKADQRGASPDLTWLGESISGDIGDITVYTTRQGRIVNYPASPALKPPSAAQSKQRLRFRKAKLAWKSLDSQTILKWESLCRMLALPFSGQNLWISLSLKPNPSALLSAANKANLTIIHPPYLPP